jgi:hypothetical protein
MVEMIPLFASTHSDRILQEEQNMATYVTQFINFGLFPPYLKGRALENQIKDLFFNLKNRGILKIK